MKKTLSRPPSSTSNPPIHSVKKNNTKQPQNKSELKHPKNNSSPSASNSTVRKSPNHISRPSPSVIQKHKSSYFKRLEQSDSPSGGSLSHQEVEELTQRFETLSKSIVELARTQGPLGVRSLEALLTREISGTLGPALNHPKFSQGFIQATRTLLDNLVSDYELGKVSPTLIRRDKNSILKANSSTTFCYRDKYLKELVINMLQSICCNEEEEVDNKPGRNLSAESQERIQDIRNMVRTELGIKSEVFNELELRVAELRKSMSKSGIGMEKLSGVVDQEISEKVDCLKIPKSARDALRTSGNLWHRSLSSGSKKDILDMKKEFKDISYRINPHNDFDLTKTNGCTDKSESKEISVGMLRKNIERAKNDLPLSKPASIEMCIDPLKSYSRKFDTESGLHDEDDDSISQDETRIFLEALQADKERRNKTEITTNENTFDVDSMDTINKLKEDSNMNNNAFLELRDIDHYILAAKQNGCDSKPIKSDHQMDKIQFCSPCPFIVEDMGNKSQDFNSNSINPKAQNLEITDNNTNQKVIHKVRSHFWLKEAKLADEIVKELQIEFNKFKLVTDEAFNELKAIACDSRSNEQLLQIEGVDKMSQYSVEDLVIILKKITKHINLLPIAFDVRNPTFSECQKRQAFGIISVLEKCFQINEKSPLSNSSDPLFPLNDSKILTISIKSVLLAFSNLGEIIDQLPREIKNKPMSALDPPETLMKTLTVLYGAEYFRDCFPSVATINQRNNDGNYKLDVVESLHNLATKQPNESSHGELRQKSNNNNCMHTSSNIMTISKTTGNEENPGWFSNRNLNKPKISPKINKFGYSSSNITVQNLSDMFLHISILLNDVPKSVKTKKLISLDPPVSLCQALGILYCSDDAEFLTDHVKTKSFASLTIQNTSDFFLTLSSTFDKVPGHLKNLFIEDLDPPPSLKKAISLLTSLSNSTIQECLTQKDEMFPQKVESQEHFFDAVDSPEELNTLPQ